ncbi:MAG: hybrid sensor histidine kinase/response regulator [Chloroflexi bacterium]|nr:hybrid sensor histidine kinase/response regulator [Chloroflexota bacterium]
MNDFDFAAYLDLFKEEVAEHLRRMTEGLLALEADASDRQPLDDLFRSAHTIKGSARMMGLGEIATLAHRMEDVLSAFRAGALAPSAEHISLLLSGLDLLKRLVEGAGGEVPELPAEHGKVLARLASALERPAAAPVPGTPPAAPAGVPASESAPSSAGASPQQAPGQAAASAAALRPTTGASARQRDFLRVPVAKVDAILDLAGELTVRRGDGQHHVGALREVGAQIAEVRALLARGEVGSAQLLAEQASARLESIARGQRAEASWRAETIADLHAEITRVRMLPLSNVFGLFHRTVRDLSLQRGKEARLVVEGGETEVDKLILEGLQEPLLHLVRNAIDHGVEPPEARERSAKPRLATLRLSARQQGDRVEVAVADDGRGIDLGRVRQVAAARGLVSATQAAGAPDGELLALLFVPGFSTSEQITETSGRGVGLDAARAAVAELGGQVTLHSRPGEGTTCTISLPLTLAYTRALLVVVADQVLALPIATVEVVATVDQEQVSWLQGRAAVQVGGRMVPLVALAEALGLDSAGRPAAGQQPMVIARGGPQRIAFMVDRLLGEESVIARSLGPILRGARLVSAGAILPDGRIALLLNASHLIHTVTLGEAARPGPASPRPAEPRARRILVVDDAATTRELERAILVGAGYEVDTAVDGLDALEKLGQAAYDGLVTDLEMPRLDGFELTCTLRRDARLRDLPVIIVTTRESQDDRRRGLEAGAQAYVLKSAFDQDNLLELLGRLVG